MLTYVPAYEVTVYVCPEYDVTPWWPRVPCMKQRAGADPHWSSPLRLPLSATWTAPCLGSSPVSSVPSDWSARRFFHRVLHFIWTKDMRADPSDSMALRSYSNTGAADRLCVCSFALQSWTSSPKRDSLPSAYTSRVFIVFPCISSR